MPGNSLPFNEVSLTEVAAGITSWTQRKIGLKEAIDLINSWADPVRYPPV